MTPDQLVAFLKKHPISIGCGVLSLALALFAYFTWDDVADAKAHLQELTAESERLSANLEYSAKLAEQYKALVTANAVIDSRLVRTGQLAQNLQYFYKLESETGTKLVELRQEQSGQRRSGRESFVPVTFGVSVVGNYASLIDFLRRVETGVHYSRFQSCTLSPHQSADAPNASMMLNFMVDLEGKP